MNYKVFWLLVRIGSIRGSVWAWGAVLLNLFRCLFPWPQFPHTNVLGIYSTLYIMCILCTTLYIILLEGDPLQISGVLFLCSSLLAGPHPCKHWPLCSSRTLHCVSSNLLAEFHLGFPPLYHSLETLEAMIWGSSRAHLFVFHFLGITILYCLMSNRWNYCVFCMVYKIVSGSK